MKHHWVPHHERQAVFHQLKARLRTWRGHANTHPIIEPLVLLLEAFTILGINGVDRVKQFAFRQAVITAPLQFHHHFVLRIGRARNLLEERALEKHRVRNLHHAPRGVQVGACPA